MNIIKKTFSELNILNDLDNIEKNPFKFFPDYNNGYFYTSGNRINLFADIDRWAIVFEQTGYDNRNLDVEIILLYYGNCLKNQDFAGLDNKFKTNIKYFTLISEQQLNSIESDFELVSLETKLLTLRGMKLKIEQNIDDYVNNNILSINSNYLSELIDVMSFIRLLDNKYPNFFRSNNNELMTCLPNDLPKIMTIDKWYHKEFNVLVNKSMGDKPSTYETFQQIAQVLVSEDTTLFKSPKHPNNDWRNWPDAGGL